MKLWAFYCFYISHFTFNLFGTEFDENFMGKYNFISIFPKQPTVLKLYIKEFNLYHLLNSYLYLSLLLVYFVFHYNKIH